MRLAISNIAWEVGDDAAIAALLQTAAVDAIDVAPTKYFAEPEQATASAIAAVRQWWDGQGIAITGMQSLLYGSSGLNVFGDAASQAALLRRLEAVCRIGAGLGATRLVFGSPRNRDRSGLDDATAHAVAVDFFQRAGDLAAAAGVLLCLEPNPARYGANFMLDSVTTASVVAAVGHGAVRMQLDTGALAINGEDPAAVLAAFAPLVGHVHASEPDLVPLGDGTADHGAVHAALLRHLPQAVVTIEMLAPRNEAPVSAVARALAAAVRHYRPPGGGAP